MVEPQERVLKTVAEAQGGGAGALAIQAKVMRLTRLHVVHTSPYRSHVSIPFTRSAWAGTFQQAPSRGVASGVNLANSVHFGDKPCKACTPQGRHAQGAA
eukprot:351269-Chlamydomonas_euryale.AAC.4